jgi:hypothetical protein
MKAAADAVHSDYIPIGVILAGTDRDALSTCAWKKKTEWKPFQLWEDDRSHVAVVLPSLDLCAARDQINDFLHDRKVSPEKRVILAIRHFSSTRPDIIGSSVLIRTSTDCFAGQWNTPAESPPMQFG